MKNLIVLFSTVFLLSSQVLAGGPKYVSAMEGAIAGYELCRNQEDFANLAHKFSRIAQAEQDEWLPSYYQAHCLIVSSFIEQDRTKKEAYIESARPAMERVMKMAEKDSEAHVLQAMFYSAELVVDPATRGQKYGMLSGQSVQVALSIDPENPRAKYMDIQNGMGTAQFFGQDIAPYCERAKAALAEFDKYEMKSTIHPAWGKWDLEQVAISCK